MEPITVIYFVKMSNCQSDTSPVNCMVSSCNIVIFSSRLDFRTVELCWDYKTFVQVKHLSFRFAVTPCVYLDYREADVQLLKRTLSHNWYLHRR